MFTVVVPKLFLSCALLAAKKKNCNQLVTILEKPQTKTAEMNLI